jgi:hypothetical protein
LTTFQGKTPALTYKNILQAPTSNSGLTTTLTTVQDGGGNSTVIQVSTNAFNVSSGFQIGGTAVNSSAADINLLSGGAATPATARANLQIAAQQPTYRTTSGAIYPTWLEQTISTLAITANTMYAIPIIIDYAKTVTKLHSEVTTGVAGNYVVGIYTDNGSGYPGTIIVQGAALDASIVAINDQVISQAMNAGPAFMVMFGSSAATFRSSTIARQCVLGATEGNNAPSTFITVAQAYSATMPASFPAAGTYSTSTSCPRLAPGFW